MYQRSLTAQHTIFWFGSHLAPTTAGLYTLRITSGMRVRGLRLSPLPNSPK